MIFILTLHYRRKKFRAHAKIMIGLKKFASNNRAQIRNCVTLGVLAGVLSIGCLSRELPVREQDDILERLDSEVKMNTSADEWRKAGMIK